jgi:transcriptional regulator with XRE-family HTH domain
MASKKPDPGTTNDAKRETALGQTLEEHRLNANLTKRAFAQKLGISSAYLYDLLNGTANPTWETMDELAGRLSLEFSPTFSRRRPSKPDE